MRQLHYNKLRESTCLCKLNLSRYANYCELSLYCRMHDERWYFKRHLRLFPTVCLKESQETFVIILYNSKENFKASSLLYTYLSLSVEMEVNYLIRTRINYDSIIPLSIFRNKILFVSSISSTHKFLCMVLQTVLKL
jgi:hypothetical protein